MSDYDGARAVLREAELALMQQREAVAAMRRDLPQGPVVANYTFASPNGDVTLSELFTDDTRPLVLYHFMFGGNMASPCPMCSMWADGWNAVADHADQRFDFGLVTQGAVEQNLEMAGEHGWQNLQWLSASANSFKSDYGSQDGDGNQRPFLTVFEMVDGEPHLSYSGGAHIDGEHWRGVDLLSPVWHLLDLTRAGRGEFMPSLSY